MLTCLSGFILYFTSTEFINGQIHLNQAVDSINNIGKEISQYDFYPEKEHKKFISIYSNIDTLSVEETTGSYGMPTITTINKMAYKDISMRFPEVIQSHNYKEVFKWIKVDVLDSDTFLNTCTDMVYLNFLPSFQPQEIAERLKIQSQILSRNILLLSYSKILGKTHYGQLDSIYTVVRDDQKIRLDFAKCLGGVPMNQLDSLPKLNHNSEIGATINHVVKQELGAGLNALNIDLPMEIYFQITPGGNATNIYTNQKVFWYYDFLEGQSNRSEIMNQGGNDYLFDPIKNTIGFTDLETLNAITGMIKELKFSPGLIKGKKVSTIHKITIRP